jgi:hypothetical protein
MGEFICCCLCCCYFCITAVLCAAGQPLESCLTLRPGHKTVTVKAVPQQLHFHSHSEHLLGGEGCCTIQRVVTDIAYC